MVALRSEIFFNSPSKRTPLFGSPATKGFVLAVTQNAHKVDWPLGMPYCTPPQVPTQRSLIRIGGCQHRFAKTNELYRSSPIYTLNLFNACLPFFVSLGSLISALNRPLNHEEANYRLRRSSPKKRYRSFRLVSQLMSPPQSRHHFSPRINEFSYRNPLSHVHGA